MELESPFADKLHTNYVPSEPEIRQIHTLIREAETEQSRLQAILDDISQQKTKVDEHLHAHRLLVTGIRYLAPEILQKIFFYCLGPWGNAVMSIKEAPLILGRICRAWRHLSLSTPELWTSLHIVAPYTSELRAYQACGDAVTAWLGRSGIYPLSISFRESYISYQLDKPPPAIPILTSVMQFSRRWKNVQFEMYHRQSFAHLALLNVDDFPLLEEVELNDLWTSRQVSSELWFPEAMFSAPLIRAASIHGNMRGMQMSRLSLCWENLTSLNLVSKSKGNANSSPDLPPLEALGILSRCRNLVTCTLMLKSPDLSHPPPTIHWNHAKPVLPHLIRLEIRQGWVTSDITPFFNALILPALRSLVSSKDTSTSYERLPFLSLVKQSHHLYELIFHVSEVAEETLIMLLSFASSLTRLHLFGTRGSPIRDSPWVDQPDIYQLDPSLDKTRLIARLTPSSTGECLCPRLEHFEFIYAGDIRSDVVILDFIRARARPTHSGIACLRFVRIDLHRERKHDILPDLQPFKADGLIVNLAYLSPHYFDPSADSDISYSPNFHYDPDASSFDIFDYCSPSVVYSTC